jgi:2-polyprenyl-6-methoxyphenol hydroxylase-like FAD-dependent oxidoreductase
VDHAIVMGGSIAGLCVAAGLARVAKRVTVLERDPDPRGIESRKSTPQANHTHALLRLGALSIESLIPGVFHSLDVHGGRTLDMAADFRWFINGRWRPRFDARLPMRTQSRPLLEAMIREHVQQIPLVSVLFEAPVEQPIFSTSRKSVTGVRLMDGRELDANLVIDATGRGSKSRTWFKDWGYQVPRSQEIHIGLSYVTAHVRFPVEHIPSSAALLIYPMAPSLPRGGSLFHLEGDKWVSTFFGYHGDSPPIDFGELIEWAGTLIVPDVQDALRHSQSVSEPIKYKVPRQYRWLYHELREQPQNYLVIGDAACCFDPVFGQGMTVAAAQAVALAQALARGESSTAVLQRKIARVASGPWILASTESQRWPATRGYQPPGAKLLLRFVDRFYAVAAQDHQLHRLFLQVMNLEKPITALMTPSVLWKVLRP